MSCLPRSLPGDELLNFYMVNFTLLVLIDVGRCRRSSCCVPMWQVQVRTFGVGKQVKKPKPQEEHKW